MGSWWYGDGKTQIFLDCGDQERIRILVVVDDRPVGNVYLPPGQVRNLVRQLISWQAARVPGMIDAFGKALREFGEAYEGAMEEKGAARPPLADAQSPTEVGSASSSGPLRGSSCTG